MVQVFQPALPPVGQTFLSVPSPRAGDVLIPPSGLGSIVSQSSEGCAENLLVIVLVLLFLVIIVILILIAPSPSPMNIMFPGGRRSRRAAAFGTPTSPSAIVDYQLNIPPPATAAPHSGHTPLVLPVRL